MTHSPHLVGYGKTLSRQPNPKELVRILRKVRLDKKTGCWVWTGHTDDKGYGQVKFNGRAHWVHRLIFQVFKGRLKNRIEAGHRLECSNTTCCNPDHIRPVTKVKNVQKQAEAKKQFLEG